VPHPVMSKIRALQRNVLDGVVRNNPRLGLEDRAEFFVQRFEKHFSKESRILDIGGGWGFYAEPLKRRGHHLTVLDVIKPGFQKAPAVIYNGEHFPFPDKSFDASLLITVLHHIPDPVPVILEAKRVTRKKLIVVEDLFRNSAGRLWTIFRDQMYNFEFFGHPCQFKKREEWIRLFESLGFTLLEDESMYTRLAGLRILNGVFVFQVN